MTGICLYFRTQRLLLRGEGLLLCLHCGSRFYTVKEKQ
jgi:hypothetical protein